MTNNVYTITASSPAPGTQITLGSPLGSGTFNLREQSSFYKRIELIELTEDLLVLACAANREWTDHASYHKLLDDRLFEKIKPEDRELAEKIADYYSKKIMWNKLKSIEQSEYRKDLNAFIHSDRKTVQDKMIPLAFKLPDFYKFDIKFDEFKTSFSQDFDVTRNTRPLSVKLKPVGKLYRKTKQTEGSNQYWMIDENSIPYLFTLSPKNTLIHLFDNFFDKPSFTITGVVCGRGLDDLKYNQFSKLINIET